MVVWVVWAGHGGMIIARMGSMLHEVAIDLTVPIGAIAAFQRLSRVTKSILHLHLRRACRRAFDLGSVLRFQSNGVDVNGTGSGCLVEVVSI